MANQDLRIPFPLRGVDKATPYSSGSGETTPYASNVFPKDSSESRVRGGNRKGLAKRFTTLLGGTPKFIMSVMKVTSDFDEPYEFMIAGTDEGIYVSEVTRDAGPPVTYTESLTELNGVITDHNGADITDHNSLTIQSENFVLATTDFEGTVTQFQGKVIFAQNGQVISTGSGTVANGVLTSPGVPDWTSLGIEPTEHICNITYTNGTVITGSYLIQIVQDDEVILGNVNTGSGDCTFEIVAAPKVLDPETQTVSLLSPTVGTIPTGSAVITGYRDRLVWAQDRVWYMSRVGDAGDYDYSADIEDAGRAVAGVNSDAGQPGDPITALVPVGYDYLLMFGDQSTWVLRGDPAFGGQLYNISRKVGCVGADAWCHGADGEVYFLSKDGIYVADPNASGPPSSMSDDRMPLELKERDAENYDVTLAYDMKDNAVVIFVTPKDGTTGTHWWFDLTTKSFWQFEFLTDAKQPIDAISFSGAPTEQRSITVLCGDGYIREISGTDDDGDTITSKIVIGPIPMAEAIGTEGVLSQLHSELGTESGTVTLEVYAGDSAETVVAAAIAGTSPKFSRTITAGRSSTIRPRLRGVYTAIVLTATTEWSSEAILATVATAGRRHQ